MNCRPTPSPQEKGNLLNTYFILNFEIFSVLKKNTHNPENPSYQAYLNSDVKYFEKTSADFFHSFILSYIHCFIKEYAVFWQLETCGVHILVYLVDCM